MRIKGIIKSGYVTKDYGYSHRMAVTHVESGKTYASVREAARSVGFSSGYLSYAMSKGGKTGKGNFQWVIGGNKSC